MSAKRGKDGKPRSNFTRAVALLLGTTIGAGIFGMPFVFAQSGFLVGMLHLLILGLIILFVNLAVGEVALRTKKVHMLAGYAGKYLGKWGKTIMALAVFFGIFGAMVAYIIGEGEVLSALFGFNPLFFSLLFFALMSTIIWFDLKAVAESDLWFVIIMLGIIVVITALGIPHIDFSNLTSFDSSKFFLPYGVVLFALAGVSAIPEMEEELKREKVSLKKAITYGTLIPFFVYAIFALVVVGITGINTTELATIGLGNALGPYMILLGNIFAALAMATSFISLGLAMKWMLHYDFDIDKKVSWFITCSIPLFIFLMGATSFIGVIGLTGAVAGGIEGILVILIAKAAKKKGEIKPAYSLPLNWIVVSLIMILFLVGLLYQIL